MKKLLLILIIVIAGCGGDEPDGYEVIYYVECDKCSAEFDYPTGSKSHFRLISNGSRQSKFLFSHQDVSLKINNHGGYAYAEIIVNGELKVNQEVSGGESFRLYGINGNFKSSIQRRP